jgi:hypothetical protein
VGGGNRRAEQEQAGSCDSGGKIRTPTIRSCRGSAS